tara:strand:- start:55 stop:813 length:759 start_codon:yes stop_codon:yes gene_type:complete
MSMVVAGIIGGGLAIGSSIFGASAASKREKSARREKKRLQNKLDTLEANRQDIINPYSGAENLSSLASDLSGMITNPFANLSVATGAAEIQIEESNIALANTLDIMRASGAGAGGATALAQAALKSKKGVAASIEMQEKQNEDKRAQGQQQMEQRQMSEQQRQQSIAISEGQRMQSLDAAGKSFVFGQQEQRDISQLDRTASLLGAANQAQAQAASDQTAAITSGIGAFGQIAGGFASAGGFNNAGSNSDSE